MTGTRSRISVIVVGAGPVGLLATLRLAQAGIQVTCFEAQDVIEPSPRAMAYHPVATRELDRAGILDDIRRKGGTEGQKLCFRKAKDKEVLATLERSPNHSNPYENLIIGQHELSTMIMDHLRRYETAKIELGVEVVGVDQSEGDSVKVEIIGPGGELSIRKATYVVAADGAKSTMRRLLDIPFEGFTYEEPLVSANVRFPFDQHGWEDANFLIDPTHYGVIARINDRGLWRVSYGEEKGLSHEELIERLPWKFSKLFPGPQPPEYTLEQFSPYRISQRCASTFRRDRVLLVGDAAHICAPFGALGCTGGLLDAAALADSLIAIERGKATEKILDIYAETRRRIFLEEVNPTTQANLRRLRDSDPDTVADRDPFLKTLRSASADGMQQIRAHNKLPVDMSQFFDIGPE